MALFLSPAAITVGATAEQCVRMYERASSQQFTVVIV